jgi:tRNA-dihydrouridine synthase B
VKGIYPNFAGKINPPEMKIGSTEFGEFPVFLAPLEDITDSAFRNICKQHGADMVYSEFVSSEALVRKVVKSSDKIRFDDAERPIGIQIFGNNPEAMARAAIMVAELKPEIIDINFGCPVRKIAMKGAGSALMKDVPLMERITKAVVKAVEIPVTVKTRLGWDEESKHIVEIAERMQDTGIKAITIHGRTRSQLYSGTADWTLIGEVRNNPRMFIPVIGNGDIDSAPKAVEMKNRYGVDAIMIGRAAIGNPWIFEEIKRYLAGDLIKEVSLKEKIETVLQHICIAIHNKGEYKAVIEMRRHYSGYFKNIPNFKQLRLRLVTFKTVSEIENLLNSLRSESGF